MSEGSGERCAATTPGTAETLASSAVNWGIARKVREGHRAVQVDR